MNLGISESFKYFLLSPVFFVYISTAMAIDVSSPYIMRDYPYDVTSNSAMIAWTTNEPADSRVEYCLDRIHCGVFTQTDSTLKTDHRIRITGMSPGTRYYYWVYSRDSAGNESSSGYRVFNTVIAISPVIPQIPIPVIYSPTPTPAPTPTPPPVFVYTLPTPSATPIILPPTPLPSIYIPMSVSTPVPLPTPIVNSGHHLYGLGQNITIEEAGSMIESGNSDWWVNSGAYLIVENGVGRTVMGGLSAGDKWYQLYIESNPTDTDNGYHPQNIFRIITRSVWKNSVQEAYFNISKYWTSTSPNRDSYNGALLLSRYVDGQNLYYAGIRVDGQAVIKKKFNGKYSLLASAQVYPGTFNRSTNPNLIPEDKWFGLKSQIKDNINGSVDIKLFIDKENNGNWELIAQAVDDGRTYGPVIDKKAFAGIRTDFMDTYIRGYKISELP